MDKDTLIDNLLANYGKYGVTKAELEPIIDNGIQNYDLSLEAHLQRFENEPCICIS